MATAFCRISAPTMSHRMRRRDDRKVKACHLFLTSFHHTHWALLAVLTGFNIARPTSPEFWSSLLTHTASTGIRISATLASSICQAYIMACEFQFSSCQVKTCRHSLSYQRKANCVDKKVIWNSGSRHN